MTRVTNLSGADWTSRRLSRMAHSVQLRSQEPDHLRTYKLETNTLENFRRIHNMLRAICKMTLNQAASADENGPNELLPEALENSE